MDKKSPKTREETSLIIRPASLPAEMKALIQIATPVEFMKQRQGKGGKSFTYVEGGYVIARLNQIFSPVGWDFEIINERVEATEVVVRGKLTIKDHKSSYTVSKTQYGTKDKVANVPLGDTLKAAATDCLKKCASLFGIGLDVYWQQLDEDKLTAPKVVKTRVSAEGVSFNDKPTQAPSKNASMPQTKAGLMKLSLGKIETESDPTILGQFRERIANSRLYDDRQKATLFKAIDEKISKYGRINPTTGQHLL